MNPSAAIHVKIAIRQEINENKNKLEKVKKQNKTYRHKKNIVQNNF